MPVDNQSTGQGQMPKTLAVTEPVMQSKKRIESSFLPSKELSENENSVGMQSKKKIEAPVSALQSEPPLQSKRRTPGPPTTLTNGFYENGFNQDDYTLLGNQDKFAENVKYKVRPATQPSRDISPPKQMKLQLQKREKENKLPSPGPVVDTSKFSKPVTPMAPRKPKNQPQEQVKVQKELNVEHGFKPSQTKVLRSPKQSESEPKRSERKPVEKLEKLNLDSLDSPTIKEQQVVVKEPTAVKQQSKIAKESPAIQEQDKVVKQPTAIEEPKPNITEKTVSKDVSKATDPKTSPKQDLVKKDLSKDVAKGGLPKVDEEQMNKEAKAGNLKPVEARNLDVGDPVKDSMKAKRIGNMNEFVQTNMEKGIVDSAPEAPADYALKYKTGIAPPRPTKKVSEYQKQFAWKTGFPASPLLKAEQVVYNSVPTLSPPKKDVIPKVSEYQKQFKEFALVPVPKQEKSEPVQSKRNQLPRSKSMEGLSPAEIPTAGSKPVIAPDNKRLTLETGQKPVEPAPVVPRKKQRQFQSEYKSNYKSPTRFDYLRGSWHGADPPQVKIKGPEKDAADSCLSNWFAEVIELRRKASEYRKRAEGTHFSREHLVQLMAKQTDLWDASTLSARSNLSALSLESGLEAHRSKQEKKERLTKGGMSTAATIASEDDHKLDSVDEDEVRPVKKQAWVDEEVNDETPRDSEMGSVQEGRLITPKLRDQLEKAGNQRRRHHLDRTTPCVGGALLSSPPQTKKNRTGKRMAGSSDNGSVVVSETFEEEQEEFEQAPVYKSLAGQKTYTVDQGCITPTPTYGLATKDTHTLRDDEASVDQPWPTEYVHSPVRGKRDRPGGLDTIGEGFGETYNKTRAGGLLVPRIDQDDDDVLSVSMQSIASSCSVASATLERARKRKEDFWGKNGIATR